jgi:hypothetical protein
MIAIILVAALTGQAPVAEAGKTASKSNATATAKPGVGPLNPGEYFVFSEVMPAIPGAPTEAALDQILVRLGKNDLAGAIELQTKGSGYLFCPPLRVKLAHGVAESRSTKYPSLRLARVAVVEGPFRGKESWVPVANLRPAAEFPAHLASLAYAERVQDWREDHMTRSPGEEGQPKEGSAKEGSAKDLIARRRAKKAARYKATLAREAEDTKARAVAEAAAKREYREALPYMLEARGQDLRRQSELERNQVWNRYLNQGGAQGVIVGPAPQPVRITNEPGQPVVD